MRGFITLAVGDERYYKLAENLLISYRAMTERPYPFAIISDRSNRYTDKFDDVIIIEAPTKSYMDKLELLKLAPYDENIFIDADCLVYGDINYYWELHPRKGVSCFGQSLNITDKTGWFQIENAGKYRGENNIYP